MHRRGWLTPAETRLAGLLLCLSILGGVVRVGDRLSPEVERWLQGEATSADSTTAPEEREAPAAPPEVEATAAAVGPEAPPPDPGGGGKGIDPNTADLNGLLRLPGVGPALARRILEDRGRNGPYRRAEDLLRVRGIGPATLDKMRPDLDF